VAIIWPPRRQLLQQRVGQQRIQLAGIKGQRHEDHADGNEDSDQAVAQLDQMGEKSLLLFVGHQVLSASAVAATGAGAKAIGAACASTAGTCIRSRRRRHGDIGRQWCDYGIHRRLDLAHFVSHGRLQVRNLIGHLLLHLFQLVKLDLAIDVALYIADVALQAPEQETRGTRHPGQALRADDDQRHDGDDHQLGKADVEHELGGSLESAEQTGETPPRHEPA
jgi:hypothetical protein